VSGALVTTPMSPEELARRRAGARRLAWVLGLAVLALYIAGMFFKR
jgi:hypothetical protein